MYNGIKNHHVPRNKSNERCAQMKQTKTLLGAKKMKTYPLQIGSVTVVRVSILLTCIHRSPTIGIQTPDRFVDKIDKQIFKFVWKCKAPRITMTILEIYYIPILPDFKTA